MLYLCDYYSVPMIIMEMTMMINCDNGYDDGSKDYSDDL